MFAALDPADLTTAYAAAALLLFALGMLAGRWSQRRQDAPFLRALREQLERASAELDSLYSRFHFVARDSGVPPCPK